MEIVRWLAFAAGVVIVVITNLSVVTTLIVPRGLSSQVTKAVSRTTRALFLFLAARFDDYEHKDKILVLWGPATLVFTLFTWLGMFFLGFGLILWPLLGGPLTDALRESGSSMLTLGFASTEKFWVGALDFVAAATGFIVIALQIAYLPTLYGAFNRRETLVTMLQSRAGSPAWGPEILMRHHQVAITDNLPAFYAEWEQWAADLAESHSTYPVLIGFRSPHRYRSWLVGLLAVMDAAAMQLALNPSTTPTQARLCIRMGFLALREIAAATGIPFDPDPFPDDPIELQQEEFEAAVHRLQDVGYAIERSPQEAWPHFQGWRVNYESVAYALGNAIVAPPGPWSGERDHLPGLAIIPQRPADRTPDDHRSDDAPKGSRGF